MCGHSPTPKRNRRRAGPRSAPKLNGPPPAFDAAIAAGLLGEKEPLFFSPTRFDRTSPGAEPKRLESKCISAASGVDSTFSSVGILSLQPYARAHGTVGAFPRTRPRRRHRETFQRLPREARRFREGLGCVAPRSARCRARPAGTRRRHETSRTELRCVSQIVPYAKRRHSSAEVNHPVSQDLEPPALLTTALAIAGRNPPELCPCRAHSTTSKLPLPGYE